jgi:UDP-glucuronate decarboxylase
VKVLITGAAGFLGSNLVRKFLQEKHQIIGLDNLSSGSLANLKEFENNPHFVFVEGDVREELDFDVEGILNFACPASPIQYQIDPVQTIETNFIGMLNVLKLGRRLNVKVLQSSTSEVYGDPTLSPQTESYWGNVNPIGIRSCYDEGKRAAETLCFDFKRQYQVDSRVIRIFNTYGPGMSLNDGRVVSNFVVQALQGQDITIYGDGEQTRSFCFVSDLVDGIYRSFAIDEFPDSPINLGNPTEFTMLELAEKILSKVETKSTLNFRNLPMDDPRQRKPDIRLASEFLKWKPIVDLDLGLDYTISYFRELIKK